MRVQSADVVDADVVLKLFSGFSSFFEEVGSEPDFFEMCLVRVFGENLFDGNFSFGGSVYS